MSSSLFRSSLLGDLNHLQQLSSSLGAILDSSSTAQSEDPQSQSQSQSQLKSAADSASASASEVLSSFSTSRSGVEESQALVQAYIGEMNDIKRLKENGGIESTGERIDALRERGEGMVEVLGGVKV